MAVGASIPLSFVFPGIDGEIQGIVVPGGLVPIGGIVAHLASCGESRRRVIGISGIVIIILVAGIAIRGSAGVAVGMAVDTLQIQMRAGEGELGLAVIKCRGRPTVGVVADGAVVAEVVLHVVGVAHRVEIILVAGETIRWRSGVAAGVAVDAVKRNVRSRQRKLGLVVVKRRGRPTVGAVADSAVVAEVILHMVGVAHRVEIILVAGETIRWRSGVAVSVAVDAIERNMRAGQRELGLVVVKSCR